MQTQPLAQVLVALWGGGWEVERGVMEGYIYFNISLINPSVFEKASESDSGDPNLNYTI